MKAKLSDLLQRLMSCPKDSKDIHYMMVLMFPFKVSGDIAGQDVIKRDRYIADARAYCYCENESSTEKMGLNIAELRNSERH